MYKVVVQRQQHCVRRPVQGSPIEFGRVVHVIAFNIQIPIGLTYDQLNENPPWVEEEHLRGADGVLRGVLRRGGRAPGQAPAPAGVARVDGGGQRGRVG